jgi:hypothetical protein
MKNFSRTSPCHAEAFPGRKQSVQLVKELPQLYGVTNEGTSQTMIPTVHARMGLGQSAVSKSKCLLLFTVPMLSTIGRPSSFR